MLDTMTLTKLVGGLCGSLLIFMLGSWAADALYATGGSGHGHDDAHGEAHHDAYPIEVAAHSGEGEAEAEEINYVELLAAADIAKGERVFKKCSSCHTVEDGANTTGPHLFGVFDRDIGSVDGFGYSGTLAELEGNWTVEALDGFIENPRSYAPGTAMGFAGISKLDDRINLIAYLQSIN